MPRKNARPAEKKARKKLAERMQQKSKPRTRYVGTIAHYKNPTHAALTAAALMRFSQDWGYDQ